MRSWFHSLGAKFSAFLHPFGTIARELAILRELYELELSSRNPPIRRLTESPSDFDTEVSYGVKPEKRTAENLTEDLEVWTD